MIQFNHVHFGYGSQKLFTELSLNLEAGHIYGLLGENGAAAADAEGGGQSDFEGVQRHERRLRCTRGSVRAVLSAKPAYMASLERQVTAEPAWIAARTFL